MKAPLRCPICHLTVRSGLDLSIHLATKHNNHKLANGRQLYLVAECPAMLACWCGYSFLLANAPGLDRDNFSDHLEASGGAELHMLAAALDVEALPLAQNLDLSRETAPSGDGFALDLATEDR